MSKQEIQETLKRIEADWDNLGACGSCGWHEAWYEVEDRIEGQLNDGEDEIQLACGSDYDNALDHRGVDILTADYATPAPLTKRNPE